MPPILWISRKREQKHQRSQKLSLKSSSSSPLCLQLCVQPEVGDGLSVQGLFRDPLWLPCKHRESPNIFFSIFIFGHQPKL